MHKKKLIGYHGSKQWKHQKKNKRKFLWMFILIGVDGAKEWMQQLLLIQL